MPLLTEETFKHNYADEYASEFGSRSAVDAYGDSDVSDSDVDVNSQLSEDEIEDV